MKRAFRLLVLAALLVLCSTALFANTVNQDVVITVESYSLLSIQDTAVYITYNGTASPVYGSSLYAVSSNNTISKKISAILNAAPPAGITLTAELAAYSTGTSAGPILLNETTSADLVTGLPSGSSGYGAAADGWIDMNYTATVAESVAPGDYTITVVYTLTETA